MIRINLLPYRAARSKENIRKQVSVVILSFVLLLVTETFSNTVEQLPPAHRSLSAYLCADGKAPDGKDNDRDDSAALIAAPAGASGLAMRFRAFVLAESAGSSRAARGSGHSSQMLGADARQCLSCHDGASAKQVVSDTEDPCMSTGRLTAPMARSELCFSCHCK